MSIIEKIRDKRILIWGYGAEGKSTELFLKNKCKPKAIDIFEGKKDDIQENLYDIIIKSPGIYMEKYSSKYTSQTELFLEQFSKQTIGITGTKGKSTTASILYSVLRKNLDRTVLLVGNIGKPCLDQYDEITPDTIIVFELSCHQLMHLRFSPHIAVFLNLYEEHLDYYKTVQRYFEAKSHITYSQKEDDILLLGENVPEIATKAKTLRIRQKHHFDLSINGVQNQYNAEFVFWIADELFGLDSNKIMTGINQFKGLPHRLELIGVVEGVRYYDDSISTIPEATICAVSSIDNVQAVLIGGFDRGIDYNILTEFIQKRRNINFICMYESGERIYESVFDKSNCCYTTNLIDAIKISKRVTKKGGACILSPAAASYGTFKNFEERGNLFKQYVLGELLYDKKD